MIKHLRKKLGKRPLSNAVKRTPTGAVDPTRTVTLRLAAVRAVRRKFAILRGRLVKLVVGEDAFGLKERKPYVKIINVERIEMPQIRKEYWEKFLTYAKKRTTLTEESEVAPESLKAVQSEFSQERVDAIPLEKLEWPILISRDGYVLDGNHRWIKAYQVGHALKVLKLGLDRDDALDLMREFPQSEFVENSFCPTGPGGGIDPTCSPGERVQEAGFRHGKDIYRAGAVHDFSRVPEKHRKSPKLESGFITTTGRYVGREEAAAIAEFGKSGLRQAVGEDFTFDQKLGRYVDKKEEAQSFLVRAKGDKKQAVKLAEDAGRYDLLQHLTTNRFQFHSTPDKIAEFQKWLRQQFKAVLLGKSDEELWAEFAERGYRKGAGRAFDDVNKSRRWRPGEGDFYGKSKEQFLRSSFGQRESVDKLKLLASRSFTDLKNVTEDMATRMSRTLMDGLSRGANPRELVDSLSSDLDISEARAETIARTECLPAETLVDAAVVRAVFRRWYNGILVDVVMRSGRKFSATPNHPMLTTSGWTFAGQIKNGDYLIRCTRQEDPGSSRDPDVGREPATLGEIFDSLNAVGGIERKGTSEPDFHGDGRDGEVDILCPDRELMIGSFAPLSQPVAENIFTPSGLAASSFCPNCGRLLPVNKRVCLCLSAEVHPHFLEASSNHKPIDPVCSFDLPHRDSTSVLVEDSGDIKVSPVLVAYPSLLPGEELALGDRSTDPLLTEDLPNLLLLRSNLLCDLPLSEAGEIELDYVVSTNLRPFAGHVFNLETPFGYFNIQGYYTGNTIRAHAEGQLDALERLGVEEVGVAVEWDTAKDGRVCRHCRPLQGVVLKIEEAHGLIPAHPNCRCAFLPSNVGEDDSKQIRGKAEILDAFEEADVEPPELDEQRPEPLVEPTKNEFTDLESLVEFWKEQA